MQKLDLAWRGYVTPDLEVIAWPAMLAAHRDFMATFYTNDEDFIAQWRQWNPNGEVDFDRGATEEAKQAVYDFLNSAEGELSAKDPWPTIASLATELGWSRTRTFKAIKEARVHVKDGRIARADVSEVVAVDHNEGSI